MPLKRIRYSLRWKYIRLKRRYRRWRMTPEQRELYDFVNTELMKLVNEEIDKQVLYGEGGDPDMRGIE